MLGAWLPSWGLMTVSSLSKMQFQASGVERTPFDSDDLKYLEEKKRLPAIVYSITTEISRQI